MIKCVKCGTDLQDGTRFCGACGTQQDVAGAAKPPSRKFDATMVQATKAGPSTARPASPARPQNDPAMMQTMAAPSPSTARPAAPGAPSPQAARPAAPVRPSQVVIGSGDAA